MPAVTGLSYQGDRKKMRDSEIAEGFLGKSTDDLAVELQEAPSQEVIADSVGNTSEPDSVADSGAEGNV